MRRLLRFVLRGLSLVLDLGPRLLGLRLVKQTVN